MRPSLCMPVHLAFILICLRAAVAEEPDTLPPAAKKAVDYARDVEPLLRARCYSCHGPEAQEGGLRLDVKQRAMQGGDTGRVIEPGAGAASRLVRVVAGTDDYFGIMPPEGEGTPLSEQEVGLLRAWIEQGAAWPESKAEAVPGSSHWSLQPLVRPAVPEIDGNWARNPIDRFVLRRLRSENVAPSPVADRATLIRRAYLDVLGLPPTPEQVDAFLADTRPEAYQRLIDELLASPHYGERWGRHWLDLARYADSDGYEKDRPRPYAWRYREWVIGALNADLPFDQFSIEQIAGDLLPEATIEQVTATGFHRNTLHNTEGGVDREEDRVKKTVDRTNTFGAIWLGLTLGCAQCHTHKYDPITQREYYATYAFFNSIQEKDAAAPLPDEQASSDAEAGQEADTKQAQPVAKVRAVSELSQPRETRVHVRGDFLSPGDPVAVAVPAVLPPVQPRGEDPDRLDLARWLFDAANPLTARVTVNRIWQRYFGRGIVPTVDDFGTQGDPPSHPELLDWLACELRDNGWSLKHIHRLILASSAYRQSSTHRPELVERDPYNVLLARQVRRRVEAEIIRDLALAVSGLLHRRIGGPSVHPPQPAEYSSLTYANSARWKTSQGVDRYRRGLYTFFQRTSPYPMLMTFDAPDSTLCTAYRSTSNTPLQALTVWNDVVFFECAQALGRRVVTETPVEGAAERTAEQRARRAFRLALARQPSDEEVADLLRVYRTQQELLARAPQAAAAIAGSEPTQAGGDTVELAAWMLVGRTLLNLDEFITRE